MSEMGVIRNFRQGAINHQVEPQDESASENVNDEEHKGVETRITAPYKTSL